MCAVRVSVACLGSRREIYEGVVPRPVRRAVGARQLIGPPCDSSHVAPAARPCGATRGPTLWRHPRPDPVARRAAASYQGGMHDVAGGDHAERAGVVAHDEPRVRIEIEGDAIESAVG